MEKTMRNAGPIKTTTRHQSFSSSNIAQRRTPGGRRNEDIDQLRMDFWILKGKPPRRLTQGAASHHHVGRDRPRRAAKPTSQPQRTRRIYVARMEYYDLSKNWRTVKRHLEDNELNEVLVKDFNKYTYGRWCEEFTHGRFPSEFDIHDWRSRHGGRERAYWKYTCWGTCHWLVNFNLRLAMLVKPEVLWRIIASKQHSTVWDGENTLFEFSFQAMGIPPQECFKLAYETELEPGRYGTIDLALHWIVEKTYPDRELVPIARWSANQLAALGRLDEAARLREFYGPFDDDEALHDFEQPVKWD
jgi:hypothetical protein